MLNYIIPSISFFISSILFGFAAIAYYEPNKPGRWEPYRSKVIRRRFISTGCLIGAFAALCKLGIVIGSWEIVNWTEKLEYIPITMF